MPMMFWLAKVNSSPVWLMPSWLRSRHRRRLAYWLSLALTMPSALPPLAILSRSANASKPLVAVVPSLLRVASPNSSRPLSMVPLPLRSSTRKASSGFTQPVPVLTPSALWSNRMGLVVETPTVSKPSPSRSKVKGSRRRTNLTPSWKYFLVKSVIAAFGLPKFLNSSFRKSFST